MGAAVRRERGLAVPVWNFFFHVHKEPALHPWRLAASSMVMFAKSATAARCCSSVNRFRTFAFAIFDAAPFRLKPDNLADPRTKGNGPWSFCSILTSLLKQVYRLRETCYDRALIRSPESRRCQ
jgi:hypothetical protein